MKRTVAAMFLLVLMTVLGCHRHQKYSEETPDHSTLLPHRVAGAYDRHVIKMLRDFKRGHVVQVSNMGSDYLVIIPSDTLFPDQSPQLMWGAYPVLNQVADFMKQFRKVAVNVTAYSSQYISVKREQSLTRERARAVADYLWSQGVDSRMMISEGAGSEKPVLLNRGGADHGMNSRIEITFRDAIE